MTSLLVLARDVLDRLGNPSFGVVENDEQAHLLASILASDDLERFANEVERLDDVAALTPYGWVWVLQFALGQDISLGDRVLTELCRGWDEPAFKALVIEVAISPGSEGETLSERARNWLEELVDLVTAVYGAEPSSDPAESDDGEEPSSSVAESVDVEEAEALLVALLIVGSEETRRTARRLANRDWPGATALAEFVGSHLDDTDPLTRLAWEALRHDSNGSP